MTQAELLIYARAELARCGSEEGRRSILRFFKPDEIVRPYGVLTLELKTLERQVYKHARRWPMPELELFCRDLWESGMAEEGVLAVLLFARFHKRFARPEFTLFQSWLDSYVRNWGHCDAVSSKLVGPVLSNDESLLAKLDAWTRARNRWRRRSAAVSLVRAARYGLWTPDIFRIAEALLSDKELVVQNGVGWLLKETYPPKPRETMAFLMSRKEQTPRVVLRYAAEKMERRDRERLLN